MYKRQTLLSAQKLSNQIESEARERADKLLGDAQAKADEVLGTLREQRETEEKRLDAARSALERFYSDAREVCAYTLSLIHILLAAVGVDKRQRLPAERLDALAYLKAYLALPRELVGGNLNSLVWHIINS